ncbi:MAG: C25 family cysteine peptidase [Candidatus Eisenbacteria bacterium]
MRRVAEVLVLAVGLFASSTLGVAADPVDGPVGSGPLFDRVSSAGEDLRFVVDIPEIGMNDLDFGVRSFRAIEIPGCGYEGDEGEPAVPIFSRLIAVPEGATVRVRSTRLEEERHENVLLLPVQPGSESEEYAFAYDPDAYAREVADDGLDVIVGEAAMFRDLRVVPLTFRPVRYDPASRTLKVTRRLEVEVTIDGALPSKAAAQAKPIPPSYDAAYEALVLNYETLFPSRKVAPGAILAIAPNTQAVLDSLQPWVEWRQRKGWPVTLVTTLETGSSASQIKSYIQGVYNDPSVSLEYVVLVGDAGVIPTWNETLSGYGGTGDLPYTQLAGGDYLPDVHIGRLSYGTMAELSIIVRKIVGYEKDPYMSDTSWFTRGVVVGDSTTSGPSCIETGRNVRNMAFEEGYTEVDTVFQPSWVSRMTTALNRGDTFFGYRGYYQMSQWSNANTYALSNGWKLPFVVILTCDTGSFASGTSRSEGFLRAGSLGTPIVMKGGIGALGMATLGTHTRYNNCLYYGIFYGMLREDLYTMGAAADRGRLEMYLNYNSVQPNTAHWYCHWMNLMGDPAVDIWTGVPATINAAHPSSIAIGANSIVVTVTEGGSPVEDALVCAWKGSETYEIGYTGANGVAELPLTNATSGSMLLTVTKHNKKPYLGTVTVSGNSHVGVVAWTKDDDGSGGSSGNGDGVVNPNETIELAVQLRNFSGTPAASVTGALTENDPFVAILDGNEDFGTIPAGGTAWCLEDFDISIDPGCPDGHVIQLGLDALSAKETWHSLIELEVVAPAFEARSWTFYNDGGNGPDPGETVQLSVTLQNDGGATATGVVGTLVSLSPQVTVSVASGWFGTIASGSSGNNADDRFALSISSDTYDGYPASFLLLTSFNGGAVDTTSFTFTVGQVSSVDPTGPDAYGYLAFENTDTGYPEAPAYSWIEIDPGQGGGGTQIVLTDTGDERDDAAYVDLPFPFRYYGDDYTQATVCSNGWIAMGLSESVAYRNWTIPGAGGPDAMIAVFWDDLYLDGSSRVFHKYDAANHLYIVEWKQMRTVYGGYTETFQAILHDPAHYPTDTGDGIIVFQYQAVQNYDPTDGYATVGIENKDQSDGVLITYFNRYEPGATTLAAGRSIKFMPRQDVATGTLEGTVYNVLNGGSLLEGVQVSVLGSGRAFTSGQDGTYGGPVPPGTYTTVASRDGFEPDTVFNVVIVESQTTVRNFYLMDIAGPAIVTSQHASTDDTLGPYVIPVTISDPSGIDEATLFWRTNWNATPNPVELVSVGGNGYEAEIPGQPYPTVVQYYVEASDGVGFVSIDPAGAPAEVYQFSVFPIETVMDDDFETNQSWTVGAGDDDATSGIWLRAEPVGTDYNGYTVQPDSDYTAPPGQLCFITGNANPGESAGTNDVDGGKTTLFSPVFSLAGYSNASVSYAVWYSNDRGSNPGEDAWLVQVTDDGSTWAALENTYASTNAWVVRTFPLEGTIDFTSSVRFRFVASDEGNGSLVEAGVDEFLLTAWSDIETGVAGGSPEVFRYGLDPSRPNPFNPETAVTFHMASAARASLRIYDVSGRLVKTLFAGQAGAGAHEVRWDGRTDAGRSASSGIYFLRLEAPGFLQVRQMTLVR